MANCCAYVYVYGGRLLNFLLLKIMRVSAFFTPAAAAACNKLIKENGKQFALYNVYDRKLYALHCSRFSLFVRVMLYTYEGIYKSIIYN